MTPKKKARRKPRPQQSPRRRSAGSNRNARIVFGVVAIVVVITVILAATLSGGGGSASTCPNAPSGTTVAFDAASAFAVRCAGCHGAGGQGGGIGPKLAGGVVVTAFPNAEDQVKLVCNGKGGMPAFKDRNLNIEQARAIVAYTRTLK